MSELFFTNFIEIETDTMRQPFKTSEMRCKRVLKVKQKETHAKPSGTNTQIHIKDSTHREVKKLQEKLTAHLGVCPSLPLILRRALSTYIRAVSRMDDKGLADEAFVIKEYCRG